MFRDITIQTEILASSGSAWIQSWNIQVQLGKKSQIILDKPPEACQNGLVPLHMKPGFFSTPILFPNSMNFPMICSFSTNFTLIQLIALNKQRHRQLTLVFEAHRKLTQDPGQSKYCN